ncbi:MAG: hypothetical protein DDT33_01811 [Firmicutes bacterium]|nr:hypothetical protein [Bacillota bacterium]
MRYIKTVPLTVHLHAQQRRVLEDIQMDIREVNGVHVPLSEMVRICVDESLTVFQSDRKFILERVQ